MPAETMEFRHRVMEAIHDPDMQSLTVWSPECPVDQPGALCFAEIQNVRCTCCYYVGMSIAGNTVPTVRCSCRDPAPAKRSVELVKITEAAMKAGKTDKVDYV